jgi:tRNA-specific 2-thiouridylase
MLARLDPRHLSRIWFPLGEQTKEETRAEAEEAGLAVARRAESQEACFLGGGDYRDFLGRHGLDAREGRVVNETGDKVGTHQGFWRFTPGQRRGLGVSTGQPAYAVGSDPATNTVMVGPLSSLARREVSASGRLFASVTRGDAKLRYRSPAVAADVVATEEGFRLTLDEPAFGVATGQTAVLYEGEIVVGAGHITGTAP